MADFWKLARVMLRDRGTLVAAMCCAVLAAAGISVGLVAMVPLLSMILGDESMTLPTLAAQYNANGPVISIPQGIIDALPTDRFQGVGVIIAGVATLTVLGASINFLQQYLSLTVVTKAIARIRQRAFRHVVHMPLGRVVERGPSEFVARIVRDAAELHRGLLALVSRAVAQVCKGMAAFLVAVFFEPSLTFVAIILGGLVAIVLRKFGTRIRRGARGSLKAQESLLRIATEIIQGLRAVKANTGEREASWRFHQENKTAVREELRVRTARAFASPVIEMLAMVAICLIALLAARQILAETLQVERFVVVLGAMAVAGVSFRPLAGLMAEIYAASAPAARMMEIIDEPGERAAGSRRRALPRHERSIEFDAVSLTYAGADRPALTDVSLRIEHGRRVAIVGPNGSGKTTLVSLLPRLLRPNRGRVLIDGNDIESVSLRSLRRQIGVVTQETVLFRGSIAENIAFGVHRASRTAIEDAARQARADEFITQLADGYDADIAEQGASLSGGQRQRLAIARAILRDPAILILDEATSQVDAESEEQINVALAEFCRGRTSLLIAHRLATVLNADWIVVMDEGRIVDQGVHDELLSRCELYHRLARTQLVAPE